MNDEYTIGTPDKSEYPELVSLWAASVQATHYFLAISDFEFYKQLLEGGLLQQVTLTCARNAQGVIAGFSGCSGNELEMLFIDPLQRGKGIGKMLLQHAVDVLQISKVSVNEANTQALDFYLHCGFRVQSRSETDGMGKPYPLLHLSL